MNAFVFLEPAKHNPILRAMKTFSKLEAGRIAAPILDFESSIRFAIPWALKA